MKYFLLGALANGLLVIGVTLLFGVAGDTEYGVARTALAANADPLILIAVTAFVTLGLSFKLAAFPLHPWMPDVAQAAPLPSAAWLSVVPKVGAALALARFLTLLPEEGAWRPMLAFLSVATMSLGNLTALWQRDLRRLLGWSSVSQSGYALMAVAVLGATPRAMDALMLFLAAYAAANVAAFSAVAALRGRTTLGDYRGLAARRPAAAAVLILAMLSLVGIPPLAGFFGKLALFAAAIDGGLAWLAVAAVLNTVLSLVYYLRAAGPMYFGEAGRPVHCLGLWSWSTMLAGGAVVVLLGVFAELLL